MKANLPLHARMLRLYQRFKQSNLTRAAFCRQEGITAAQFIYWCKRFERENNHTESSGTLAQLSASVASPTQDIKELEKNKASKPEISSGFTQLHLPQSPAPVPVSTTSPAVSMMPLMVLNIVGKGKLEFYTPVEASFLKALLS